MASGKKPTHDSFIQSYVAIIVLFCASGTGIFGAMHEGMTGDPNILIAKSFLDFFTAIIFAVSLGIAVSAICAPMLIIQLTLAACATLILPLTTPAMMATLAPWRTAAGGDRLACMWNQNVSDSEYAPGAVAGDADFRRMGDVFLPDSACNNNKVVIDCAVYVDLKKFR
ncbi:Putative inner membrane protein YqgA [Salmonella enterica subsp. enterica]|uniref:Inner membrane protein YqgA n=1 Tax=Salmonella enterica I TaxID=59201 RepID=A0A379VKP9_SALET|nr:Putative inner membrane protein YqgA [Salmonella enterica subsp. enterica]